MSSTTVTGTINGVGNQPIVNGYIYFRLKSAGTDSAAATVVDRDRISAKTDENGQFSVTLWDNGNSGIHSVVEIELPSKQRFDVVIPPNTGSIDLWKLIYQYQEIPSDDEGFLSLNNFTSSTHVGDGSTVSFTLDFAPRTEIPQAFVVGIDGALQSPVDAYTISRDTGAITFSSAPPVDAEIIVTTSAAVTGHDISDTTVIATGTTTTRKLVDRFADVINVKDFGAAGDGVADDTAAIQAAWAYIISTASSIEGDQLPAHKQKALFFPSGTYSASCVLDTTGTGFSIYGEGTSTVLEGVEFQISGDYRGSISSLMLAGSGTYGLSFAEGDSELARQWLISDVYIRDRGTGINLDGSSWNNFVNVFVEKCNVGLKCSGTSGDNFTNCEFNSCSIYGIDIRGGGELKFTNSRAMNAGVNNLIIVGTDSSPALEHYFNQCTFTNSAGIRDISISSVTDNNGFAQVTLDSTHKAGVGVEVTISGSTNYDGTHVITDVVNDNVVVLDIAYVATNVGTLSIQEWDVKIINIGTAEDRINDMFFVGGNINYLGIFDSYNISFNATRLKNIIYLNSGCNRISFVRSARGRYGNSSYTDIPISGSETGYAEIAFTEDSGSRNNTGDNGLRLTAEGQTLTVDTDGVIASTLMSGNSGVLPDDTSYSFIPPFSSGFMIITNGAGQNARMAQVAFSTIAGNMGNAGYAGSVMNIATGALNGTTSTDTKINISAHTDGRVYIENRSGSNQNMYWTIMR